MASLPFTLRRPWLLLRDLTLNRDKPDLEGLRRIRDPERFLWAILPHAARSFSICITLLPAKSAKAAAVAYLNCRILDSYEDLAPDLPAQLAALERYAARFVGDALVGDAPPLPDAQPTDERDRAHLLLVERCAAVDRVFLSLPSQVRVLIGDLVRAMAAGMARDAQLFHAQGGVLRGDEQRARYAAAVLGEPMRFVTRLTLLQREGRSELSPSEHDTTMRAGTFFQLANMTRDVEKDLERGIAYHGVLAEDLGETVPRATRHGVPHVDATVEQARIERVRAAREHLLRQALHEAPAYGELLALLDTGKRPGMLRASAMLMLSFTDRHYRGTAVRCAREAWGPRESVPALVRRALVAVFAPARARREASTRIARMTAAAQQLTACAEEHIDTGTRQLAASRNNPSADPNAGPSAGPSADPSADHPDTPSSDDPAS
ncbi:MAG: hypothetical protein DHS20C15_33580 [Planctomycetota bacterium]|nr:MAG: hypothetical protein DHS20C15_33580 [Planctomycetota bacterium]